MQDARRLGGGRWPREGGRQGARAPGRGRLVRAARAIRVRISRVGAPVDICKPLCRYDTYCEGGRTEATLFTIQHAAEAEAMTKSAPVSRSASAKLQVRAWRYAFADGGCVRIRVPARLLIRIWHSDAVTCTPENARAAVDMKSRMWPYAHLSA